MGMACVAGVCETRPFLQHEAGKFRNCQACYPWTSASRLRSVYPEIDVLSEKDVLSEISVVWFNPEPRGTILESYMRFDPVTWGEELRA
jgi:hypothetical protein